MHNTSVYTRSHTLVVGERLDTYCSLRLCRCAVRVDLEDRPWVAAAENVRSMPTFKLYRYGAKVEEFSGADPNKLAALINQYLPTIS